MLTVKPGDSGYTVSQLGPFSFENINAIHIEPGEQECVHVCLCVCVLVRDNQLKIRFSSIGFPNWGSTAILYPKSDE